jgi:hypothetical protein
MAQATITRPTNATEPIARRLRSLRRRISTWHLVDGCARLLFWTVVLFAIDFALDFGIRLDLPSRVIMLCLAGVVLLVIIGRRILRPQLVDLGDDALCLSLEEKFEQLEDSLISSWQFAQTDTIDKQGVSPVLVAASINQGVDRIRAVKHGQILNRGRYWLNLLVVLLAGGAIAAIAVGVSQSAMLGAWYQRNLLLIDTPWPQDAYLQVRGVEDGNVKIPRGDDWTLRVDVAENSPYEYESVHVDFRPSTHRPSQVMEKSTDGLQFTKVVPRVIRPFRFRVRSGRSRSPWYQVVLVDRPEVAKLRLAVTPPAYTQQAPFELPSDRGPHHVLAGSRLEIAGEANKPLSSATVDIGDLSLPVAIDDETRFSVAVDADQLTPGTYEIHLADTETPTPLTSSVPRRFTLKQRIDQKPRLKVKLIGISAMVTRDAKIPIECQITDDFSITDVRLTYRWRTDDDAPEGTNGAIPLNALTSGLGTQEASVEYLLDVSKMKVPVGAGLSFRIEADDNDAVSGPKTGASEEILLKVVAPGELRANMLRREKEQRQELEQVLKVQQDLRATAEILLAESREQPNLTDAQRHQLMQTQKRQRLLATNVESIVQRLSAIVTEVKNNQLEDDGGRIQTRLRDNVITPLKSLADPMIPDAADELDRVRQSEAQPDRRNENLKNAIDKQEGIVDSVKNVIDQMVESENYQEAVNAAYEVLQSEKRVRDLTIKAAEEAERLARERASQSPEKKDDAADEDEDEDEEGDE